MIPALVYITKEYAGYESEVLQKWMRRWNRGCY